MLLHSVRAYKRTSVVLDSKKMCQLFRQGASDELRAVSFEKLMAVSRSRSAYLHTFFKENFARVVMSSCKLVSKAELCGLDLI
jgi:hypothetical protein